jgi:hypothetical protein
MIVEGLFVLLYAYVMTRPATTPAAQGDAESRGVAYH